MEERVRAFEEMIGGSLPADYKEFLINNNNKDFKPLEYHAEGERLISYVMSFFYLTKDRERNLFTMLNEHKKELVNGIFPIAQTPNIDLVVMSVNEKDYGSIYHWDYKCEPEVIRRPSYKYMMKSALSFTEFYESLIPYEG